MWYLFCYPSSPFLNQQQISDPPSTLSPLRRLLLFLSPNNRQLEGGGTVSIQIQLDREGGGSPEGKREPGNVCLTTGYNRQE